MQDLEQTKENYGDAMNLQKIRKSSKAGVMRYGSDSS